MLNLCTFLLFATTLICSVQCTKAGVMAPDFETSMGKNSYHYRTKFSNKANRSYLEFLKTLYERNKPTRVRPAKQYKIPPIIHFIWVGGKPLPEKYKVNMESWRRLHPDWKILLWTDKEVAEQFSGKNKLYNQVYYDKTKDPVEKANLLRYEILLRIGGLYGDIDMYCLQPFHDLHLRYKFFTGICPADCAAMLNNALIGSTAGHPILKHCIETVKNDAHKGSRFERNGVQHYSRSFRIITPKLASATIALPPTFFYPLYKTNKTNKIEDYIAPETHTVHYWDSSPVTKPMRSGTEQQKRTELTKKRLLQVKKIRTRIPAFRLKQQNKPQTKPAQSTVAPAPSNQTKESNKTAPIKQ